MHVYIIERLDQGGGFVSVPGSKHSYTQNPLKARKFDTIEAARRELCVDNEVVVNFWDLVYR